MPAAYFHDKDWDSKKKRKKRIAITGIGAVTPLGNSVDDTWVNLVKGNSGIGPITIFDPGTFPVKIGAEVKNFTFNAGLDEDVSAYLGRGTRFCLNAAKEALENAGLDLSGVDTSGVGISLGCNEEYAHIGTFDKLFEASSVRQCLEQRRENKTGHPITAYKKLGNIWPFRRHAHMAAHMLSMLYNIQGPITTTSSACASSAQAIGKAMHLIQDGDAEIVLTGGCDSIIGELPLAGFYRLGALSKNNDNPEKASRPFDRLRDGFVLGEGSGILILEELTHARKRNAPILAELVGYGSSSNANKITAPPEDGQGAALCINNALNDAECSPTDIDYVNAHGTSTYLNDKSETVAIKNVLKDRAYEIPVSSNKSMLGHLVASAASIELIISVQTILNNMIPPTINYENPDPECDLDYVPNEYRKGSVSTILSNSFAFGGQNASVIVKKFQ